MLTINVLKATSAMEKEKRSELVGALVTPTIKDDLTRIAQQDDRSLSFVAGALIERGLDLYRRDGILKAKDKDGKLTFLRPPAKTEEPPRKKRSS